MCACNSHRLSQDEPPLLLDLSNTLSTIVPLCLPRFIASGYENNPAMLEKIAARRGKVWAGFGWPPPLFLILISIVEIAVRVQARGLGELGSGSAHPSARWCPSTH